MKQLEPEGEKHSDDCDKQENYTDGIFWTCFCGAVNMNTFTGAHFKRAR